MLSRLNPVYSHLEAQLGEGQGLEPLLGAARERGAAPVPQPQPLLVLPHRRLQQHHCRRRVPRRSVPVQRQSSESDEDSKSGLHRRLQRRHC